MADAPPGDAGGAPELGDAVAALDARPYLRANCYFHPDRLAAVPCSSCGRTLCPRCAHPAGELARCAECGTGVGRPAWICPRCGWVTLHQDASCGGCGGPTLLPRRPDEPSCWERRFPGREEDSRFWAFGLGALGAYGVGLLAAAPQALQGEPHSPAWWVFLVLASAASGLLAAALAVRASRFEMVLSESGIEVRHRARRESVAWDEITGLELAQGRKAARLVIHAPGRRLAVERSRSGWEEAVGLIRQYAVVAPPPD